MTSVRGHAHRVPTHFFRARYCLWGLILVLLMDGRLLAQGSPQTAPRFDWPRLNSSQLPRLRLTLLSQPKLRIGSADGADFTLFNGIAGAVRLATGEIVIGDAGNRRVLYFDANGEFVRSVGRVGDGPGEFRQPRWFGKCANGNLAYHDGAHARLTFISSSGQVLGSEPLPVGANFDQLLWCSGEHRLFVFLNQPRDPLQLGEYLEVQTTLIQANGARIDTLAKPGAQEYYIGKTVRALTTVPLGNSTKAIANSKLLYICTSKDGACELRDTEGKLVRTFALNLPRRKVAPADWTSALSEHYQAEPARSVRTKGAQLLKEIRPRETFPSFDQLRIDVAGNLWVRTFDNFSSPISTWMILSQTGRPIAFVALRRSFQILEIGADFILGFVRDADGVEFVELHMFSGVS